MLPLSDGVPARRFPVVSILLIVANFAVFIVYELPNMNSAVYHASFYPCTVDGTSGVGAVRAQLDHRHVPAWELGPHPGQHALPAIFGKNVEGALQVAPEEPECSFA